MRRLGACAGAFSLAAAIVAHAGAPPGMVAIPGGEFQRGLTYKWADYDVKWYPNPAKDDTPVRKIHVDAFSIDEAEVTNQRYAAFVQATHHRAPFDWREGKPPDSHRYGERDKPSGDQAGC